MIRSPQNSHSLSAQGINVRNAKRVLASFFGVVPSFLKDYLSLSLLLQVGQNSSPPTSLSFGDHLTQPKQLAVKFVQVRRDCDHSGLQQLFCSRSSFFFFSSWQLFNKLLLLYSAPDRPHSVKAGCPGKH